jgi:tRNA-specific adenosine deaminase 3
VIRRLLPGDGGVDLQHLRRFAKVGDVPNVVREVFERVRSEGATGEEVVEARESGSDPVDLSSAADAVEFGFEKDVIDESDGSMQPLEPISKGTTSKSALTSASALTQTSSMAGSEDISPKDLFLIVGSTNAISRAAVAAELSGVVSNAIIFSIQVPQLAPTSQEQATLWSSQYWPTVYKKSNPFGPHPSIVSRTEQEIRGDVGRWMRLASNVACQADTTGSGEPVGVVIVERMNGVARPIAVAADARWVSWPRNAAGNVTAHAALRAISMVAAKLKSKDEEAQQSTSTLLASTPHLAPDIPEEQMTTGGTVKRLGTDTAFKYARGQEQVQSHSKMVMSDNAVNIFQDKPFLAAERNHYDQPATEAGYLCHDLEIYCTHEPCIMCSMAIVHSRFGKAIFQHRMPKTGGMCADGDLGHGLFWRKELNWTLLAWQWLPSRNELTMDPPEFHA